MYVYMMPEISIKRHITSWLYPIFTATALLPDGKAVSEWGKSEEEAVGRLIYRHRSALGVGITSHPELDGPIVGEQPATA